ncbi:MAG: hypothetical protein ACRDTE_23640 [Pseudonocardiaceae bacterium]
MAGSRGESGDAGAWSLPGLRAVAGRAMNDEAMTYRPLLPLSGSELIDWIALRRVCGGGVVMLCGRYVDHGRPVPGYLDEPLAGLSRAGLIALADIDTWGQRRVAPTLDGRARYVELSAKRAAPIDPPTGRIPPRGPVGSVGLDRPPPDDQPADRRSVEAGGMAS